MALKILVVDDAAFIRELLIQICQTQNWQVVGEARDGQEAVTLAKSLKPDVVIMDLIMPEKNGIDATKEILAENPTSKIIACSTVDETNLVMRALDAGCSNYIVKPFENNKVIEVINSAMGDKK